MTDEGPRNFVPPLFPDADARIFRKYLILPNRQFFFLFVNNRLEGNAPLTILSLVDP